jgi:integrase/recombinase XerD
VFEVLKMTKRRRQGQSRGLAKEEVKSILNFQKGNKSHGVRNSCLFLLSVYCGFRVVELSNLLIRDVLNEDGSMKTTLILRREYTKGTATKRQSRTGFLVHKEVVNSLEKYLTERKEKHGDLNPDSHLFQSQKGGGFSAGSLQRVFKNIYKTSNLDEMVSSHSGRRTFCSNLVYQGVDLNTVKELMGHRNIQTTINVYVVKNPKLMEDVSRNMKLVI